MNFFDAAADLIPLGFKVFPIVPGRKIPLIKAWQRAGSDDLETITTWANEWPDANIGIATGAASGVVVIDVDVKEGKNGPATLEALAKQGKTLPPSPITQTPTGGRHRFFRAVPGIRNAVEIGKDGRGLGRGIDVRGEGGFIVAPPSRLVHCSEHSAGAYRWQIPPMTADFPRLPHWAVKMLLPRSTSPRKPVVVPSPRDAQGYRRQALADLDELAATVSSLADGRHQAPFQMACRIGKYQANGFLTAAEIEGAILNASGNNGALSKYALRDLTFQIANGLRRAQADALPPLARIHREQNR
jgi:hypothetical protein